jgi:hypothetical protein
MIREDVVREGHGGPHGLPGLRMRIRPDRLSIGVHSTGACMLGLLFRVHDLAFYVQAPGGIHCRTRSQLARDFAGVTDDSAQLKTVLKCRVHLTSTKGKTAIKRKMVGRASLSESRLLNEVV